MKSLRKRLLSAVLATVMTLSVIIPVWMPTASAADLAEYEQKTYYKNEASPMNGTPKVVTLTKSSTDQKEANYTLSLDGTWKMISTGKASDLAAGKGWEKAYNAEVPGSIYTALMDTGAIADPYVGDNMKTANQQSQKNWYFLRTFTYEGNGKQVELAFEGLCNVADIYLNGTKISSHEGMFGGPFVDVTDVIKKGENTLMVHLYPAKDFYHTVVFNCSYGWHYAKLFPLGIWQSVTIRDLPSVTLDSPFITTTDYTKGTVDLAIELDKQKGSALSGELTVSFTPKNFEGETYFFKQTVYAGQVDSTLLRYRCDIPNFKLWWPNGYGDQNLYTMKVTFKASDGTISYAESDFGIRQLDYKALPDDGSGTQNVYNRVFVINGKEIYMKGAGWCTLDSMMRFTREDYDRILSRAKDAGINYLRSWGGGLVETDEFYDLCDEYGICVYQEWPCCWDSTTTQPAEVLYETVVIGAKRLRNRASLVVWGGGNEGTAPYTDTVLNNIGKLTYETDGTRDFWRQDGGTGGSQIIHDHIWWSGESPEHYLMNYVDRKNVNLTEYGLGAMMNLDSIAKYAPAEEMAKWPINQNGVIAYHTATFNGYEGWTPSPHGYDIDTLTHYASKFLKLDSLEDLVLGSQMAQAQADYLPAINARIQSPYSSMNVVYKLNDNYPGASWSIVDWYSAPKIAYYMMQDAYRSLMAAPKMEKYNYNKSSSEPEAMTLPIYVLDDVKSLEGKTWSVKVTAYDENLIEIKTQTFNGSGSVGTVGNVGDFTLTAEQTDHSPLTITFDLYVDGKYVNRTFVYFNYEQELGSLFYLPRTSLAYSISGNTVTVKNTGTLPALGVEILTNDTSKFVVEDNFFFLAAGETVTLTVNDGALVEGVTCFNFNNTSDKTAPTSPNNFNINDVTFGSATLSWDPSEDEGGLFGYEITLTDKVGNTERYFVQDCDLSLTLTGLEEMTKYTVSIEAIDNGGNRSAITSAKSFTTLLDLTPPSVRAASFGEQNTIVLTFSTPMNASRAEDPSHYMLNHGATVKSAVISEDRMTVTLNCEGIELSQKYTVGVIGLIDTKYSANNTGFISATVERDLYLSVDFEQDDIGHSYSGGEMFGILDKIVADPTFVDSGHVGQALAAGAGLKLNSVDYTFGEGKSIIIWVNGKASAGYNVLLAKGPKTTGHFEFYTRDGHLWFYAPEIGDCDFGFNLNSLGLGWHQLAFVWENGRITVYADGAPVGGCAVSGTISEIKEAILFGGQLDGTMSFGGMIDTVRLYNRVVDATELSTEGLSETYINISENLVGKSIKTNFAIGSGSTVNLWFKTNNIASNNFAILLAKGTKSSNNHWEIYTEWGRLCFYSPSVNSGRPIAMNVDLNSYLGDWHMLTVIHTESQFEIYMDGSLIQSVTASFSLGDARETLYYGRLVEGGFDFPGQLGEVEILNEILTNAEITDRYNDRIVTKDDAVKDGINVEHGLITLLPGETAPLGITALNGTVITIDVVGDAATLSEGMLTAEKLGETLIYVYSQDGQYIAGVVVRVVESVTEYPPDIEDTTEPEESVTDPTDTTEESSTNTEGNTERTDDSEESSTKPNEKSKNGCKSTLTSIVPLIWLPLIACYALFAKKKTTR